MSDPLAGRYVPLGDGRVLLEGTGAALCRWFDRRFLQMAIAAGATEYRFPATIARETLARAGYLDAFPGGATALAGGASPVDYLMPPAVCYHAYALLAGRQLHRDLVLTAAQRCFREADRAATSAGRLWEFTMREVIFVGAAEWVAARRDDWAARIHAFSSSVGLSGSLEPATDPFFGPAGHGRRLLQQVKGLKYELRLEVGTETLALASFNLHERFFGDRFAIRVADDSPAYSGCAAMGLERWALAFLRQRGDRAADALIRD